MALIESYDIMIRIGITSVDRLLKAINLVHLFVTDLLSSFKLSILVSLIKFGKKN